MLPREADGGVLPKEGVCRYRDHIISPAQSESVSQQSAFKSILLHPSFQHQQSHLSLQVL